MRIRPVPVRLGSARRSNPQKKKNAPAVDTHRAAAVAGEPNSRSGSPPDTTDRRSPPWAVVTMLRDAQIPQGVEAFPNPEERIVQTVGEGKLSVSALLRINAGSGRRKSASAAAVAEKTTRKAAVIASAICQSGRDASFRDMVRL